MFKGKNPRSTREFIGIERFGEFGLITSSGEIVFFGIRPTNLSTLSEESIRAKIYALTTVLKGVAELEMLCLNSREDFEGNKRFLRSRLANEDNSAIRRLLERDVAHLDAIQAQTATAREFFIVVRVGAGKADGAYLGRIAKLITDQGFAVRRADLGELKKLLAVYFEQNVTTDRFEDFDGERWVEGTI